MTVMATIERVVPPQTYTCGRPGGCGSPTSCAAAGHCCFNYGNQLRETASRTVGNTPDGAPTQE